MVRCEQALLVFGALCGSVSCTRGSSSDHDVIGVALVKRIGSNDSLRRGFTSFRDKYEITGTPQDFRVLTADVAFDDGRGREMRITLHPDDAIRFSDWTATKKGSSIGISIDGRMVAVRDLEGRLYDTLSLYDFEWARQGDEFDATLRFPCANSVPFAHEYASGFATASWVELERTSCEGRCPAYSVRVLGNGTVIYTGVSGVAQVGERLAAISYEATRRLLLRFAAADFFARAQPTTQRPADSPAARVTLLLDGKAKRLESQVRPPGSMVSPSETDKLVDVLAWAIDLESRSARWTGRLDAQPRPRVARSEEYAAKDPGALEISLSREGCFGRCPVYEIVIRGDGSVTYKGELHVGVLEAETSISRDIVEELLDRFQELGFWEMHDRYDMLTVTDIASMSLRLRIGDRSKTVENRWIDDDEIAKRVGADLEIHRTIETVAHAIDTAVDARSWVFPRKE